MEKSKMRKKIPDPLRIPASLLVPVYKLLKNQLKELKKRKKKISLDDPFKLGFRLSSKAAPDANAEEQFGHARTTAIRRELDRKMIQTRKALARIKIGGYGICESCGKMIDTDRLMVYPEATYCIKCESKKRVQED